MEARSVEISGCGLGLATGKVDQAQFYLISKDDQFKINLLKAVVKHFWDDSCQKWAAHFQARVRVHLNQVESEVLVDHKVVAKELYRRMVITMWKPTSKVF